MKTEIDEDSVKNLLAYYTKNSNEGNAREVAAQYAPDATIEIVGSTRVSGLTDIFQSLRAEYAEPGRKPPKVHTDDIHLHATGQYAFAYETCVEADGSICKVWMKLGIVNGCLCILEEQILCIKH